jgi:antitoxin (DNA-binding transcriptional repressor) of toxin-antitoxin stability system
MRTVGIRALQNSLSEYIRRIRAGETVLVTDRGEIVGELSAPAAPAAHADRYSAPR